MGHFYRIVTEPQGQPLRQWINEVPNDGIIRYLDFFNRERIAVFGSRALAEVLIHRSYDFVKPSLIARGIGSILGVGLLLAEGTEHKRQRRNLLPAFSHRNIRGLQLAFWTKTQEMIQRLGAHIENTGIERVDTEDWVSRAALDIIGLATFGHDFQTVKYPSGVLAETYRRILSTSRWSQLLGFLKFFLPAWFLWMLPVQYTSEITQASNVIKQLCRRFIQERQDVAIISPKPAEAPGHDILSIAISSCAFSTEDLVNQLMTFLVAGHETTTAAMSWSIYELCRSPTVQQRIREEVRHNVPQRCFQITGEQEIGFEAGYLDRCLYLQAFVSEILRLYPPIPLTMRVAARNTDIAGTLIPKGTTIILAPWAINTSIALWGDDAHLFKPERWLKGCRFTTSSSPRMSASEFNAHKPWVESQQSEKPKASHAFMTFLHGPRSCIGQSFARAELMCLIAAWVDAFDSSFASHDASGGKTGSNRETGEYVHGVKAVTGISARPGNLQVRIKRADE
ncbi:MAG: hypothetical protein Q9218_001124 [Villophora microphyllina]